MPVVLRNKQNLEDVSDDDVDANKKNDAQQMNEKKANNSLWSLTTAISTFQANNGEWIWPTDMSDAISLVRQLLEDNVYYPLLNRLRRSQTNYYDNDRLFWSSRTALVIYADLVVALLLGRFWILWGAALALLAQMLWIVAKWILYIVDDEALHFFIHYFKFWIVRFITEGEKVLKGDDAIRYIVSYAMLKSVPTGVTYFRWLVRYNMRQFNLQYVETIVSDRFERPFPTILQLKQARDEMRAALTNAGRDFQEQLSDRLRSTQESGRGLQETLTERLRSTRESKADDDDRQQ